jgi:hypothetical protein
LSAGGAAGQAAFAPPAPAVPPLAVPPAPPRPAVPLPPAPPLLATPPLALAPPLGGLGSLPGAPPASVFSLAPPTPLSPPAAALPPVWLLPLPEAPLLRPPEVPLRPPEVPPEPATGRLLDPPLSSKSPLLLAPPHAANPTRPTERTAGQRSRRADVRSAALSGAKRRVMPTGWHPRASFLNPPPIFRAAYA